MSLDINTAKIPLAYYVPRPPRLQELKLNKRVFIDPSFFVREKWFLYEKRRDPTFELLREEAERPKGWTIPPAGLPLDYVPIAGRAIQPIGPISGIIR